MTGAPHVLFRADASSAIGTGHVVRCLTLGAELRRRGWTVSLASRSLGPGLASAVDASGSTLVSLAADRTIDDEPTDLLALVAAPVTLVVVDHYGIGADWQRAARPWARWSMAIDDLADRPQAVDLLLNQNLGASTSRYEGLVPPTTPVLAGPQYALLRPAFAEARARSRPRDGTLGRILVFMSGTDPHDVTGRAAAAATTLDVPVDVVVGSGYRHLEHLRGWVAAHPTCTIHVDTPDMAGLMSRADVAIGAPGSASWERCTLGLPTVLVTLADNQVEGGRLLAERGAGIDLGWHETVDTAVLENALTELRDDPARLVRMSEAAAAIADGRGTDRVADAIERLVAGAGR